MRLLVIGREGQLARSLVRRSADRADLELIAAGRPELDLERPAESARFVRDTVPDIVVNAAAYTAVDQAEDEPERARLINAIAPGALAEAARAVGAAFVQISTDYVFDGRAGRPYREEDPTAPASVYGRTKLEGEERVRAAGGNPLILRTAWIYSPFGRNFVRTMMTLARERDEVRVVADQHGSPTSALDLADAVLKAAAAWRSSGKGDIYHVAGSGSASWCDVAAAVFDECERLGAPRARAIPIATADWPARAPRPPDSRLDDSRFVAAFGFALPPWRASLRQVVAELACDGGAG